MDRAISVVTKDADGQFLSTVYASNLELFRVEPAEYQGGVCFSQRGSELLVRQMAGGGEGCKVVLVGVAYPLPDLVQSAVEGDQPASETEDQPGERRREAEYIPFFDLEPPQPLQLAGSGHFLVQCVWANGKRKVVLLAGDQHDFHTVVRRRLLDVESVDGNVIYLEDGASLPVVQGVPKLV